MSAIAAVISAGTGAGTIDTPVGAPNQNLTTMANAFSAASLGQVRILQHGHARLAHRALHVGPARYKMVQPLVGEDGQSAIVLDGYLANRDEILKSLAGETHRRAGQSDAEIMLAAWNCWGKNCLQRFDGEFVIIVCDREGRYYAACDHQAMRQLYYHVEGETVFFASEMQALLAGLPSAPPPNLGFLTEVITDRLLSQGETLWDGIYRIPSAHVLEWTAGRVELEKYWSPPIDIAIRHDSDEKYAAHYLAVLTQAVREAARSDRPLAIEVSGGLDSSAVYAVAKQLERDGKLDAPGIIAFTLAGEPGTEADELAYARAVTAFWDDELVETPLFQPDLSLFAKEAREDRNLPLHPNGMMAREMFRAMAERDCRVVLSGLGGDQWLNGHPRHYHDALAIGDMGAMARAFRADLADFGVQGALLRLARQTSRYVLPARGDRKDLRRQNEYCMPTHAEIPWVTDLAYTLLSRQFARFRSSQGDTAQHYKSLKAEAAYLPLIFEANQGLLARFGIEDRQPMHSRRFIEFSCQTPEFIRKRGNRTKFIHRLALRGLLPEIVLERNDKAAFDEPFLKHRSELKALLRSSSTEDLLGLVEPKNLNHILPDLCSAAIDNLHLWPVWGAYGLTLIDNPVGTDAQDRN